MLEVNKLKTHFTPRTGS